MKMRFPYILWGNCRKLPGKLHSLHQTILIPMRLERGLLDSLAL
jgi:hypothetical protein